MPVFPVLNYGITPYFRKFPGTVSLRLDTYQRIVADILDSVAGAGFTRILFVNGHGGNIPGGSILEEWMNDHPGVAVKWHNWWNAPRTDGGGGRASIRDASHASWMENFPWTRLAGVEDARRQEADDRHRDACALMDATAVRELPGRRQLRRRVRETGRPDDAGVARRRRGDTRGDGGPVGLQRRPAGRPTGGGFWSGARARSAAPWRRTFGAPGSTSLPSTTTQTTCVRSANADSPSPAPSRSSRSPLPAFAPDDVEGVWDTVFLCVKALHTDAAARELAPHLGRDGVVVSLQNGFNEIAIAEVVGAARTMGAFVNFGADVIEPGVVHYGGRGAVVLGELDGRGTRRLARIHHALLPFEPKAITTDNIWGYLWGKMGYGSLLFASALTEASIVDVLNARDPRPALTSLAREVMTVAEAEGVSVLGFNGYDPAAFGPGGSHGGHRRLVRRDGRLQPSLRQDAQRRVARHRRPSQKDRGRCAVWATAEDGPLARYRDCRISTGSSHSCTTSRPASGLRRRRTWPSCPSRAGKDRPMHVRFDGRTAVVTGAAHGFGRAIALSLASLGARVVACDILADELDETARLAEAQDAPVAVRVLDVTDRPAVHTMARDTLDAHGRIDILVNDAGGVMGQVGRPLEDVSEEDWRAIFAVNLDGAFYCSQAVAPAMKAARFGRIVNISSGAGLGVSLTGIQAYASAKAGQIGLTRQLAHELGPWGITVNCIAPGFVRSNPTTEAQWQSYGEEGQRRLVGNIALRRLGTPQDIASGVIFFASEHAGWVTGQTLSVDGGR